MSRRNRKQKGHENHERWLITYADLITLLLIFFVIMYAMSKVDMNKYEELSRSLHLQFTKADSIILKNDGIQGDLKTGKGEEGDSKDLQTPTPTPAATPGASEQEIRDQELRDLLTKVNQYINENHLEAQVAANNSQRGVVIKLNDLILFDLGKADLKPAALPILNKLASLFQTLNTKVSIEGHTDDLPLQTGSLYRDNWGLSQARSVSVVRHFLTVEGMRNDMFVSAAYADTMPVAPNDSEANRAKNRRVEIIVLREPIPH
ncbi:flagellar motor protein MotB [Gorillibacterium sp. sgz5001074]|uniref:flagellar motor protein MotB n=1 Tax=Gorillibacterium sp. sgz5001074 TaxID=3446695 RepID=UPI003F6818B4